MPTINLAPNETSDPIAVPPLRPLGIDADKPITIATEAGSVIARTQHRHAIVIIPPTSSIVIGAGDEGAEVEVTISEAE